MARKYRQGRIITSINELIDQEFIYIHHKIWHKGWFRSLQFGYLQTLIEKGFVRYAIKIDKGENKDATLAL